MAGLALIVIILAWRRFGGSNLSWPMLLWLELYLELYFSLILFSTIDLVGGMLLVPAFILLFTPSFVLKRIVVPLGLPRVAYWTARWCRPLGLVKETTAGAVLYGALAFARKPSWPQTIGWLEQRANRAQPLRGAGVVAAGLLAALRGDRNRARCLFLIADTLAWRFIPRNARVIARDWLVADAARIGNWREVIRLGRRGGHSRRWSYTVARMGERLNGDPKACHDWQLWFYWVVAPRRWATLELLERALAVPRAPRQTAPEPSAARELPYALANLAHALEGRFAREGQSLVQSVCAVDTTLERSTTRALVQQRLLALGARHDPDTIISGFRSRLVDLLAPVIEESPNLIPGQERSPILEQAIERVRIRLFGDIEAQCKDYSERQRLQNSLDAPAEWAAWALMRDSADRLLELVPGSEHALFHTMHVRVCNFAVFQHNDCKRPTLAHDIYSWLWRRSQSDPSASLLLLRNMQASEDAA